MKEVGFWGTGMFCFLSPDLDAGPPGEFILKKDIELNSSGTCICRIVILSLTLKIITITRVRKEKCDKPVFLLPPDPSSRLFRRGRQTQMLACVCIYSCDVLERPLQRGILPCPLGPDFLFLFFLKSLFEDKRLDEDYAARQG